MRAVWLRYVEHYNNIRLNGAIAPKDMLAGHQQEIQADRDRKLEAARERKNRRQRNARRMKRITSDWLAIRPRSDLSLSQSKFSLSSLRATRP
jgi:hypothetical protein